MAITPVPVPDVLVPVVLPLAEAIEVLDLLSCTVEELTIAYADDAEDSEERAKLADVRRAMVTLEAAVNAAMDAARAALQKQR